MRGGRVEHNVRTVRVNCSLESSGDSSLTYLLIMVAEAAKGSWADVHQPVSGNYGCCCVPCLDVEHGSVCQQLALFLSTGCRLYINVLCCTCCSTVHADVNPHMLMPSHPGHGLGPVRLLECAARC